VAKLAAKIRGLAAFQQWMLANKRHSISTTSIHKRQSKKRIDAKKFSLKMLG